LKGGDSSEAFGTEAAVSPSGAGQGKRCVQPIFSSVAAFKQV